ncbi:hypothetical protein [Sphingobium algorifonticola]|uniref:hypothetical protein n=1 Tax=Sphingobium algorifonticola TaxID=2008318 RepID=UPI001F494FE2|nr:hypothetical protein [Sphingobium algorifonticola]
MRDKADDFTQLCRRMQLLMQDAAPPVSTAPEAIRLDDMVRRLSQRMALRRPL